MNLVFFILLLSSMNCHKVLRVSELKTLLDIESRVLTSYDTCLSTNGAFVYFLQSNQVALLPNDLSDSSRGLVFNSKDCYERCLANDQFPIENNRPKIEEKYESYLFNIKKSIEPSIQKLSIGLDVKIKGNELTSNELSDFLMTVKQKSKLSKEEMFLSSILLGEYIKKIKKGQWVLLKQYGTFNPYYTPAIVMSDKTVILYWNYLNSFFSNPKITPETFVNLSFVIDNSLKIDSKYIQKRFAAYFIPE